MNFIESLFRTTLRLFWDNVSYFRQYTIQVSFPHSGVNSSDRTPDTVLLSQREKSILTY